MGDRTSTLGGANAYRRDTGWRAGTCTWCKAPVQGRRKWCSDACVLAYMATNNPHDRHVRTEVWKRAGGCCAGCACSLRHEVSPGPRWTRAKWWHWPPAKPWDLDHIVPVAEGGGKLGLSNLQVLCKPCHKAKTAEQAARAAAARRQPEPAPKGRQEKLW